MNGFEADQGGEHARRLRAALDLCACPAVSAAVLRRIAGQSPQDSAEAARIRALQGLTLAAASVLVLLFTLGRASAPPPAERLDAEAPALLTLEEDGYGTYMSTPAVLEELLTGEVME
ncbi:MAG: hypothetical protein HY812_12520 [Planctomycetes bacterium]|nr:hypothetical protein [Planctomycetota bacterium]